MCLRLQPHVSQAATPCASGCNPICLRLQPHVPQAVTPCNLEAATPCASGCNPMCLRLQPHVTSRLQPHVSQAAAALHTASGRRADTARPGGDETRCHTTFSPTIRSHTIRSHTLTTGGGGPPLGSWFDGAAEQPRRARRVQPGAGRGHRHCRGDGTRHRQDAARRADAARLGGAAARGRTRTLTLTLTLTLALALALALTLTLTRWAWIRARAPSTRCSRATRERGSSGAPSPW